MTVKRRPVRKGAMRTLFANVARKKKRQRAATAAPPVEIEGDVPNLGVARALVVLLIIHVVAIAGIFAHSRWFAEDEAPAVAVAEPDPAPTVEVLEAGEQAPPKLRAGERFHTVGAGESYGSIAERYGVSVEELRRANPGIMSVRSGRVLKVPEKTIVAVEPAALSEVRQRPPADPPTRPAEPEPVVRPAAPPQHGLVETEAAREADARMVRPAGEPPAAPAAGGDRYKVRSGDTFWGIAQKYGTTVDAVMKANGISDPRKLRAGMTLVIPR